jgi:hypothetical protein
VLKKKLIKALGKADKDQKEKVKWKEFEERLQRGMSERVEKRFQTKSSGRLRERGLKESQKKVTANVKMKTNKQVSRIVNKKFKKGKKWCHQEVEEKKKKSWRIMLRFKVWSNRKNRIWS